MEITFKEIITTITEVEHKKEIEFPYYSKTDTGTVEVIVSPTLMYCFATYSGGDYISTTYKTESIIHQAIAKNTQITKEEFDDVVFELRAAVEARLNKISPPPSLLEQIKPLVEPKYEKEQNNPHS